MKTPSDINPLIIDRAGLTVAQILADNEDRWNELYEYLGVTRVAHAIGFALARDPSNPVGIACPPSFDEIQPARSRGRFWAVERFGPISQTVLGRVNFNPEGTRGYWVETIDHARRHCEKLNRTGQDQP